MSGKEKASFVLTPKQKQASSPGASVWVSANAGSGKTHVLVDRVIRLMLAGAAPDSILCITYTKAAASEMAGRLYERLGAWTGLDDQALAEALTNLGEEGGSASLRARARRLFTLALETPGGLKIQTIHAFCERLLHLFPVEAGMSPGFRVMDERTEKELQAEATAHVLRQAETGDDAALQAIFHGLTARLNAEQFAALIAGFLAEIHRLGEAAPGPQDYRALLCAALGFAADATVAGITARLSDIDRAAYQRHAAALKPFGPYSGTDVAASLASIAAAPEPEEQLLSLYLTAKQDAPLKKLISKEAAKAQPEAEAFLNAEKERVFELLRQRNTLEVITASTAAYHMGSAILKRLNDEKRRLGLYGFDDLIARTARLLTASEARAWVRFKLDPGISHILLDEAQDTSPAQWQIIRALADEFFAGEERPRTLFVVGDPKQSIYSFQGADAASFAAIQQQLTERHGVGLVDLATSYRSTEAVLEAVDRVFTPAKLTAMGIAAAADRGHTANRKGAAGRVELWPLFEDDSDSDESPAWDAPVDRPPQSAPRRQLAHRLAQTLKAWLSPQGPRRLLSAGRALRPDDVLILFQSRGPLFRMVLAELRKAGVPVAGADRLNLLQSLIVQDLLMLLQWLLLPEDDHALAIILKSPLVPEPLDDDALVPLCHGRAPGTLAGRLTGPNAKWLQELAAGRQAPFGLLSRVLTDARAAIMARLGTEALEASDELLNMALDYEREQGTSLFGFLTWFRSAETTLKREMEKGAGEVRLMTVHGAKGLEAPIVFLADAATLPQGGRALPRLIRAPALGEGAQLPLWLVSGYAAFTESLEAWPEAEKSATQRERDRLLYVAMTRAADELYVAGVKPRNRKPPEGCWWTTLTAALGEPQGSTPLRLPPGEDAPHLPPATAPAPQGPALPPWAGPAAPEGPVPRRQAVTARDEAPTPGYDARAARRGRAIHRLMEELAEASPAQRRATAEAWARALGLDPALAEGLATALAAPELAPFLGPDSAGEVDIAGELPGGEAVSGRIDRLAIRSEGLWILDYKTDRSAPESLTPAHPYARQMASYVALLAAAYPGRPITAALYWTEPKRLEILPQGLLTAALQESEAALA